MRLHSRLISPAADAVIGASLTRAIFNLKGCAAASTRDRPPPAHPHLYRDIVFNEQLIAVLRELMGPGIVLTSCKILVVGIACTQSVKMQPLTDQPRDDP